MPHKVSGRKKIGWLNKTVFFLSVETKKFYKALSQVGTDFSLMGPLFPSRKRRELKVRGYLVLFSWQLKKISVECVYFGVGVAEYRAVWISSLPGVTAFCSWARH